MLFAADNREFRATWSITWHQFSGSMTAEQMKARTREILDKHVEAGMNAVLWHIRQGGTVYYPSAIEPWGSYIGYSDPGYDPLAYAIEEAHKRGLELHGWFNTFHCSSMIDGAPAAEHPEWVNRDGYGNAMGESRCLSPGLKEVRDYIVDLVVEVVDNYDLDGIHFDYIRWNEYDTTEASTAFAKIVEDNMLPDGIMPPGMLEYLEDRDSQEANSNRAPMAPTASIRYLFDVEHPESGGVPDSTDLFPDATPGATFPSWAEWRRETINILMETLHDTINQIKPWVKMSPAALGRYKAGSWNGYYSVFQDAAKWFNKGWIDLMTPMCYHWLNGRDMVTQLTTDWQPNISAGRAVGRPFSVGPGSYLIPTWGAHKGIVEACRELPWVMGFQFFSYGNWRDSIYPLESSHTVFANMTKQPSYDFMNSTVPPAPALAMSKQNDSLYTLTVTPDVSVTDPQWYVIYRSKSSGIDVDSTEIVKIVFSDSVFTYDAAFDGLQLNTNRYYYGVTQCSRYWVESPLSNIVSTDVLPTVPPVVTYNDPANAATEVPNNKVVRIEFNKNMDAESLVENLAVSPEPANMNLSWDHPTWVREDHLILNIAGSWDFNTLYTVTIGAATLDQAGMQIDGNKDGTTGDAYSFSFTISGADEEPPIVESAFPGQDDIEIDTDMPVSIMFNELIDKASLAGRLMFRYKGYDLEPANVVFTGENNKSYLNVKPQSFFPSSSVVTLNFLEGITDTAGNPMSEQSISFKTDSTYYTNRKAIDYFTSDNEWKNPTYSGSTVGISESASSTTIQSTNRVPGVGDSRALKIVCVPTSPTWFARIHARQLYLSSTFDKSMDVLQAYMYGDGSGHKFRFSIREDNGSNTYEVSPWFPIDWVGWKLVEWDIHDPSQFGEWGTLTNGVLDGTSYGFESIQFSPNTNNPEAPLTVFIDQLRMADKSEGTYPENHPPVIESMSDTSVTAGGYVYCYAVYSDPDESDVLTMNVIPDTSAIATYVYSTPGKMKLKPDESYSGNSNIMVTVTDNGIGELADTAYFTLFVVESAIADIPETFKVYQNYPNPFNPATTLSFDLPVADQVKVEIFNTRGQKVATVVDNRFEAGQWNIRFDASFLSSGVYFYKVTAGGVFSVKRMTLLK
jgi:uncharacterized lipoprotein YddW (UPF0748 family)